MLFIDSKTVAEEDVTLSPLGSIDVYDIVKCTHKKNFFSTLLLFMHFGGDV